MTELKPCPFCGGDVKLRKDVCSNEAFYTIHCDCGCRMDTEHEWETETIDAWNTRVIPTAEVLPVGASQLEELQQSRQSVEYKTERIMLDIGEQVYQLMQTYNVSKEQLDGILGINQTSEELKPCPFCGGTYIAVREGLWRDDAYAQCLDCGCGTISHSGEKLAIKAWNTRAENAEIDHYKNKLNIQINENIELLGKYDRQSEQLEHTQIENVELKEDLQAYKLAVKYLKEQLKY